MKSYDDKIMRLLKLATKVEQKNLDKIVKNRKFDVVLFLVDTDYDKNTERLAKYINKLSERLKTLGTKSVLICYFDINENGYFKYEGVSADNNSRILTKWAMSCYTRPTRRTRSGSGKS